MKHTILLALTLLLAVCSANGQTLLNGDFETTTVTTDQINLTNSQFNADMSDVHSFGSWNGGGAKGGDPDIITSGAYCNGPESGKHYIALTGGGTDAIALSSSTPLVAGNTYVISFWDEGCDFITYGFEVGVSTNDSTLGSIVFTAPKCVNGTWENRVDTFVAPVSGQYITFSGITGDIGCWGELDNVVLTAVAPPLNSPFVLSKSICQGQNNNLTYTGNGLSTDAYTWSFDGGDVISGSGQGPYQIAWKNAGTYYVSLQVADSSGNMSTTTIDTVVVNAPPTSTFSLQPDVMPGKTTLITYTGDGNPSTAFFGWNFNGATPISGTGAGPIDVMFKNPGSYELTLIVTENGCSSLMTKEVVNVTNPLKVSTPVCSDSICMVGYDGVSSISGTYGWSFPGANVLAGSGAGPYTLQYTTPGTYIVSITFPVKNGIITLNDTVNVTSGSSCTADTTNNTTTGINSVDGKTNSVAIYPNPTMGDLNVNFNTSTAGQVKLEVYDVLGRVVIINDKTAFAGSNSFIVNTSSLSAGSYFVRITDGKSEFSDAKKFIKLL